MLDGIEPGACSKHPPCEDSLQFAGQQQLVDLNERGGLRRLRYWTRVTNPRRDLKRAKLLGLVDGNFERRDRCCDFVQTGKNGNRVFNLVGQRRQRQCDDATEQHETEQCAEISQGGPPRAAGHNQPSNFHERRTKPVPKDQPRPEPQHLLFHRTV